MAADFFFCLIIWLILCPLVQWISSWEQKALSSLLFPGGASELGHTSYHPTVQLISDDYELRLKNLLVNGPTSYVFSTFPCNTVFVYPVQPIPCTPCTKPCLVSPCQWVALCIICWSSQSHLLESWCPTMSGVRCVRIGLGWTEKEVLPWDIKETCQVIPFAYQFSISTHHHVNLIHCTIGR